MAFLDKTGLERFWAHVISQLNHKVEKVDGKGLSTNDFTNEDKEKLAGLNYATDEEIVAMMIEEGILSVVHTEDGEVLATDESSILML